MARTATMALVSAVPPMPTAPMAKAIGTRRKVSASIAAKASSASVTIRLSRERVVEVDDSRHDQERDDRVDERRVLDQQHGGRVAVGGGAPGLAPHQVREAKH